MLIWLKIRLIFYIFIFALQLGLVKIGKNRLTTFSLFALLIIIWLVNFNLYKQKSQPQIELVFNQELSRDTDIKLELKMTEIDENLKYYQELQRKQPNSRDLLFNLATLQKAQGQQDLANENLNLATELDPNF